ncbi:MAG: hypothetical protein JSV58_04520 [Candidatus Bathyarchaeota archaeon]|nr:MAG: hypothetical protein JSV58_04520 [Candidatus Bathyarchaeota archaeon]
MKKANVIIIILSALLVITNVVWLAVIFYKPSGWHLIYETGDIDPFGRYLYTDAFEIESDEWYVIWHWNGEPESGTRLDVGIYDAYGDDYLQSVYLLPGSPRHYMNITGRFYLVLRSNQAGLTVKVEVWGSDTKNV